MLKRYYSFRHLFSICVVFVLCACNHPVFYQPRPYDQSDLAVFHATSGATELEYRTKAGRQIAYYLAPLSDLESSQVQVWILFGGISSLALEWLQWLRDAPREHTGYLLIDYPGYGLNEGVPRAKRILESSLAALETLAKYTQTDRGQLERALNVLGHSLGTGTALQFAVHVKVRKIILVSPFTELRHLSTYRYGGFLGGFLNLINPEKYDNVQRLAELAARRDPPQVFIFHGDSDDVIPVGMGRELASLYPTMTTYHELNGVGHSGFFADHMPLILDAMSDDADKPHGT
jgi:pimeloyl-ACP methyl ester carboxylesterase